MRLLALLVLLLAAPPLAAQSLRSSLGALEITEIASGLRQPWGLAFLPGGGFLVTERGGALWRFDADGSRRRLSGVPKVAARGQGGLLDVLVARDFTASREIFLSYAAPGRGGQGTALAIARLSRDGSRLERVREVFRMTPFSPSTRQFGSRIVETADGKIFLTIGDRVDRDQAQSIASHNGSVIRLDRDGSVPPDNPFAARGGLPELWSIGHRNAQGMALDSRGRLWLVEHGARGGDEVNLVRPGRNYGWPVISYGVHYSGAKIGEGTEKPGMEQPAFYWDPSIAPSGLMIHSGRMFPEWKGDFFVGSLKFDMIVRLRPQAGGMRQVETLSAPETGRVRDVREAPDGSIWFLSVDRGAVYRISRP